MMSKTLDSSSLASMIIPSSPCKESVNDTHPQTTPLAVKSVEVSKKEDELDKESCKDHIMVAVRLRSSADNTTTSTEQSVALVNTNQIRVSNIRLHSHAAEHTFTFDRCFGCETTQQNIFDDIGQRVLKSAFEGYNVTVLAYGQTGSGKTFTMMGKRGEQRGLIPRICKALLEHAETHRASAQATIQCKLEASYLEIYCETIKDLLNPTNTMRKGGLVMREHPTTGVYCEDLSIIPIQSYNDVQTLMRQGDSARTVAATKINAASSRSHAIFTLTFTQTLVDEQLGIASDKISKVHLVDLAGSERANRSEAKGQHLKEAQEINKSLTTLGRVIKALADQSQQRRSSISSPNKTKTTSPKIAMKMTMRRCKTHIPFRDSVLTWLLKGSFGIKGNARTIMMCTISCALSDYEETLSTLRYANSAKMVVNKAVVNDDASGILIRTLRAEIAALKSQLGSVQNENEKEVVELTGKLQHSQKIVTTLNMSWDDKLRRADEIKHSRETALKSEGITTKLDNHCPYLCGTSETECVVYHLQPGITEAGSANNSTQQNYIYLSDKEIPALLCSFLNASGIVSITPAVNVSNLIHVNDVCIQLKTTLTHGDQLNLGHRMSLRFYQNSQTISTKTQEGFERCLTETDKLDAIKADLHEQREHVRRLKNLERYKEGEVKQVRMELERERIARQQQVEAEQRLVDEERERTRLRLIRMQNEVEKHKRVAAIAITEQEASKQKFNQTMHQFDTKMQNLNTKSSLLCKKTIENLPSNNALNTLRSILFARHYRRKKTYFAMHEDCIHTCMLYIDEANAMAHALGHEVCFHIRIVNEMESLRECRNLSLRTQQRLLLRAKIQVRMITTLAAPVTQSFEDFINLVYSLREFYAHHYESRSHHRQSTTLQGLIDPIERLIALDSQPTHIGVAYMQIDFYTTEHLPIDIAVIDYSGYTCGVLRLKLELTKNKLHIDILGIYLHKMKFNSIQISCFQWRNDAQSMKLSDIPQLESLKTPTRNTGLRLSLPLTHHHNTIRTFALQITAYEINPNQNTLQNMVTYRRRAFERVCVVKQPEVDDDGNFNVPHTSKRCEKTKNANTFSAIKKREISRFLRSPSLNARCAPNGTFLYVTIDVQQLDIKGTFQDCPIKNKPQNDSLCVFRLSRDKPKRFCVTIVQNDNYSYSLESCARLRVCALRCGIEANIASDGSSSYATSHHHTHTHTFNSNSNSNSNNNSNKSYLQDCEGYDLDIVHENANVHNRTLSFNSVWPAELSSHSYISRSTLRGSRIYIDIELEIFVCWQDAPVILRHTLVCKGTSTLSKVRSLLQHREDMRHVQGVYALLVTPCQSKSAKLLMERSRRALTREKNTLLMEITRQRLSTQQDWSLSASERLIWCALEMKLRTAPIIQEPRPEIVPKTELILAKMMDQIACERSGFLLLRYHSRQQWKRYFFELRLPLLTFFCEQDTARVCGIINVVGARVHSTLQFSAAFKNVDTHQPFTFIVLARDVSIQLQASCQEDKAAWMNLISRGYNIEHS